MYDNYLIYGLILAFIIGITAFYFMMKKNKEEVNEAITEHRKKVQSSYSVAQLQLQSYERLILLADRISLHNLVPRVGSNIAGSAKEMQILLVQNIKQEFEYNVSQQIYVSKESWDAITNLKDQNILIINQVASFLPETASAQDLNRALLEMLVEHPNASLHKVVMEVLSFEAKKIL